MRALNEIKWAGGERSNRLELTEMESNRRGWSGAEQAIVIRDSIGTPLGQTTKARVCVQYWCYHNETRCRLSERVSELVSFAPRNLELSSWLPLVTWALRSQLILIIMSSPSSSIVSRVCIRQLEPMDGPINNNWPCEIHTGQREKEKERKICISLGSRVFERQVLFSFVLFCFVSFRQFGSLDPASIHRASHSLESGVCN